MYIDRRYTKNILSTTLTYPEIGLRLYFYLGVTSKKNSIFTDIVQIDGDPPPSYPIFDKFIFDKVLTMLTSLPPLEFLTKIMKF